MVAALCSGVLPSPPRAWTSEGSSSTSVAQPLDHPEVRGREDVHRRPPGQERCGLFGRAVHVEQAESAGPPRALQIEIGAMGQQQIEQRQVVFHHCRRTAVEGPDRRVHQGADLGMGLEQRPDAPDILCLQRELKLFQQGVTPPSVSP